MLVLGARALDGSLPPTVTFWRKIGQLFVTQLCMHADAEAQRPQVEMPAPDALRCFVDKVPLMPGAEYVDAAFLLDLWDRMQNALRVELEDFAGSVQDYVRSHNQKWHGVGRVCFHLAENKTNPNQPFAFLATYTETLGEGNRLRHLPLSKAMRNFASRAHAEILVRILEPVRRAASQSAVARQLLESKALFAPQGWTASEAYDFLRDVPIFEKCGVTVRVPDWWRQRARPQATVTVGTRVPSKLGMDAILDFDVHLTLNGERLTQAQWRSLARETNGLIHMRGQWVEVDGQRLQEALEQLGELQRNNADGLSFAAGMRLLAGMPQVGAVGAIPEDATETSWSVAKPGPWLKKTLAGLRDNRSWKNPKGLQATLRPYQQVGIQWLANLRRLGVGACLADDMGLGKTLQVLALLLMVRDARRPSLIIVPASLLSNWQQEAQRFAPSLRMGVAHNSAEHPATAATGVDAVLTTLGTLQRQAWLRETPWELLIVDEAQAIKNPNARQTCAVKGLAAKQRIALTGTPVENRAMDLWSIFDFINPGLLGTAAAFAKHLKRFEDPHGPGYAPLRQLVHPYIMRRLKTDKRIIDDLPEKTEMLAWCGLRPRQAMLYQQTVDALMVRLKTTTGIARRGLILSAMTRLKQICNHPAQWLGDGDYEPRSSGKFERLAELCETIGQRQEKVLVFTQYREITAHLQSYLTELLGKPGLVLHGGTPVKSRQQMVKRFQDDDDISSFVLSLKAGGAGLNLTAANHVIHFDRWWNPSVEKQATDRAFRIGQKNHVVVHKFVCRGTVEEKVDAMLTSKERLSHELLSGGGEALLTQMNDEQLLDTLRLDIHRAMKDD